MGFCTNKIIFQKGDSVREDNADSALNPAGDLAVYFVVRSSSRFCPGGGFSYSVRFASEIILKRNEKNISANIMTLRIWSSGARTFSQFCV